jgi:5,10-methylenetetrahydromethanopterin reductase
MLPGSRGAGRHAHRADPRACAPDGGAHLTGLELGLGLQSDTTVEEYERVGRRAEAAGFDVISVFHDLYFQPALYPLLMIARVTERMRLGPAALNASTLHPVELAGQVAALDAASNGRAYLGLVAGSWLDQLGLVEPKPLTRLREAVEVVRRLLAGDTTGFAGERFTLVPGAKLAYEPLRASVPLMIGTWRRRTAAYAATVADEVKIGGTANPEMVRLMRGWLGPDGPRIVVGAVTVVDEDGAAARARAAKVVELYLHVVADLDPTLALKAGQKAPLEKFTIAGTAPEVAAQARELLDAGAHRVEFGTPQGRLDLLCDRVLPELRG